MISTCVHPFPHNGVTLYLSMLLLVCLLPLAIPMQAQVETSSSINGTVTDSTGAVVVGAAVTVKNQDTGETRKAVTNSTGYYSFPSLPPGTYTITVSMAGFKTVVVTDRMIQVAQPASVDVTLAVGTSAQTVNVSAAGAELISTTTSEISGTISPTLVESLPLNGHDMFDLAVLTPGTSPQYLAIRQILGRSAGRQDGQVKHVMAIERKAFDQRRANRSRNLGGGRGDQFCAGCGNIDCLRSSSNRKRDVDARGLRHLNHSITHNHGLEPGHAYSDGVGPRRQRCKGIVAGAIRDRLPGLARVLILHGHRSTGYDSTRAIGHGATDTGTRLDLGLHGDGEQQQANWQNHRKAQGRANAWTSPFIRIHRASPLLLCEA